VQQALKSCGSKQKMGKTKFRPFFIYLYSFSEEVFTLNIYFTTATAREFFWRSLTYWILPKNLLSLWRKII